MATARLFFRVIEDDDGTWACRRGREELDRHVGFDEALDHVTKLASVHRPAEVFVHHFDGRVHSAVVIDGNHDAPQPSP